MIYVTMISLCVSAHQYRPFQIDTSTHNPFLGGCLSILDLQFFWSFFQFYRNIFFESTSQRRNDASGTRKMLHSESCSFSQSLHEETIHVQSSTVGNWSWFSWSTVFLHRNNIVIAKMLSDYGFQFFNTEASRTNEAIPPTWIPPSQVSLTLFWFMILSISILFVRDFTLFLSIFFVVWCLPVFFSSDLLRVSKASLYEAKIWATLISVSATTDLNLCNADLNLSNAVLPSSCHICLRVDCKLSCIWACPRTKICSQDIFSEFVLHSVAKFSAHKPFTLTNFYRDGKKKYDSIKHQ